jgi:hypothetical protein
LSESIADGDAEAVGVGVCRSVGTGVALVVWIAAGEGVAVTATGVRTLGVAGDIGGIALGVLLGTADPQPTSRRRTATAEW